MTAYQYQQAYAYILKNGYSLNVIGVIRDAWEAYKKEKYDTELEDVRNYYPMFGLIYFALGVLPIAVLVWLLMSFLAKSFSFLLIKEAPIAIILIISHIFLLTNCAKAYTSLQPNDKWNGKFADKQINKQIFPLFAGIIPLSIIFGTSLFLLGWKGKELLSCANDLFLAKYYIKNYPDYIASALYTLLYTNLAIVLLASYLLIAARLALPIMLYANTNIWKALGLSIGITTRKFFHFLLLEITYLIAIILSALLFLFGMVLGLSFIRINRFLVIQHLIKDYSPNNNPDIDDNIEALIEEIGK